MSISAVLKGLQCINVSSKSRTKIGLECKETIGVESVSYFFLVGKYIFLKQLYLEQAD